MTYASHPDVDSGKAVTIPFCLGFEGNTDPKAEVILNLSVFEENALYPFLANWRRGMKLNHFFLLISLVILGFACPFSASVTPTNPAVPTSITPTPAIPTTSIPATNVPTTSKTSIEATVASTLTMAGPYLVYVRDQGNGQELVLMDADGKGEKTFPFPMNNNLSTPRLLSNMVSPDGLWLAVAENKTHWGYSYSVQPDGTLQNKQQFYWFHGPDWADDSGVRAWCMDRDGRLYAATRMGVQVFDRNGRVRCILPVPGGEAEARAGAAPQGLCFGGANFNTLYVTCGDKVYKRTLKATGAPPWAAPVKLPPWGAG